MNAEIKNDPNNKDTVEQAQSTPPELSPEGARPLVTTTESGDLATAHNGSLAPSPASPDWSYTSDLSDASVSQSVPHPARDQSHTALQATITLNRTQGRPSKVSQLPPELIAFVNEELLRRVPYRIIAGQLAERGYPGFTQDNLSTWKLGAFSKWAQEQQTLAQQNRQRELALDYARTRGTSLLETLEEIHAQNLYEAALGLNPSGIIEKFQETPELFLRMNREISAFVRLCREKKPRAAALAKKLESPNSEGWEREKKGGLTIGERDVVRAGMGIRPPSPEPQKPDPIAPEPEAKPESTPP